MPRLSWCRAIRTTSRSRPRSIAPFAGAGGGARIPVTIRVGIGYDVHPFGTEGPLVLGGVEIPGAPGLAGHSDADAVAHAVADALLGPAGLDDLGTLYPATTSFEGAISMELLAEVVADVARAGWSVANVDVVIAAERPSLARHLGAMRASLATRSPHRERSGWCRVRLGEAQARRRRRRDRPGRGHRGLGRRAAGIALTRSIES